MSTATYDLHALIEEARRRARRRRWAYAGVLALVAGAGIWGGLALSGGSGAAPAPPAPPGYHLVKARGDVQHALLADSSRFRSRRGHAEVWFDRKLGLVRVRGCWFFRCADESARCVPQCAWSMPLLERYWPLDTSTFVRLPGLGRFHGRRVIWIGRRQNTFPPAFGYGEWIALDPQTHQAIGERSYDIGDKPLGRIFREAWVLRRFPDVPPNRFWFAVKNKPLDFRVVRLQPIPLDIPGREPASDLLHASGIVVGRLARATIFASVRRDGSWRLFSVSEDGRIDGHSRVDDPHTLRAGLVQVGHGSLFTSRAYLVVAGSMFARRGTELFATFADGSRQRIKLIAFGKPSGRTAFHYYLVPRVPHARAGRVESFQLVRGSRVLARERAWPDYQAPEQPDPLPLRAALRVFGT